MFRFTPLLPVVALLLVPQAAECQGLSPAGPEYKPASYEKKGSLQETLLATRQQYSAWLAEQPAARKTVELDPWLATPLLPSAELDKLIRPGDPVDPAATLPNGHKLWSERKNLVDGKVVKFISGSASDAVYLTRSIRVPKPARLTLGIGGGDRLGLWLNGRKLTSADTHLNIGRYGTSTRADGTRVDRLLVDLDLQAGTNRLTLRLTPASEPSFYFSTSPDPVPRLWERILADFPAARNPLLELVHADWFATAGWFAAKGSELEEQFVDRLAADCGDDRASVSRDLQQLRKDKVDRNDRRWLDLCVKVAVLTRLRTDLDRLRSAVIALGESFPKDYPAAELLGSLDKYAKRLSAGAGATLDPTDEATLSLIEKMPRMRRRMLVELNPLLRDAELLFVRRYTYNSRHYYDDFQHISRFGGNLCVLSLADGTVRQLAPQLAGGVFDRYDLSFDAKKVVFGYHRPRPEGFRIYEIGIDGSGLRQVTRPPADEAQRIATYGNNTMSDGYYGVMGYHFWTDDIHPCYLPDGGICFASTRSEHGVLCTPAHFLACTNLFRMNADGSGMRPMSRGALSEFTPTMMEDGRILYNRWEYVYKGIAAVQSLWTMRLDGSGSEEFYGDNITNPGVFWQARQVPGRQRQAICIGCGHEPLGVGQVLLVNLDHGKRMPKSIVSLTPNVKTQGLRGLYQLRNGVWREDLFGPFYADPYPLSDKFFLVACNPNKRYNDQSAYGIYLLDTFGNRVPIHDDPEMSCWQPMLLKSREVPPQLPALVRNKSQKSEETATLFLNDVYRGLDSVEPGSVKYIRVMEQIAKPWAAEVDPLRGEDRSADNFGGHIAVSHNAHIWIAVLHGIVPVEEDGSACFEVPADRNLFFQALDKDFMEVQRMRTFVNFEPGERRGCIGCHEYRRQAPVSRSAIALGRSPSKLAAQPGEIAPRPLHYPSDVQPILDRHCTSCHNGKDPKAKPDLRGELTTIFSRSYENLFKAGQVDTIQEWAGLSYSMENAEAVPPYSHGSHQSKLVELLKKGHYDVKLSGEEWVKLATWIDCGAPYYGSYYGRRHIRYQGQPDFRPVPTLASACGVRPNFPAPPKPKPLPAKLLAWWPLDESTPDSAADASGNEHKAKLVGAAASEGRIGSGARRLDGTGYIQAAKLGKHDAISVALWVKADSLQRQWNPLLFCDGAHSGVVHFSLLRDGTPNVAVNTNGRKWTHCKARRSVPAGQWHHVILVCDGRTVGRSRFYVDGQPAGDQHLGVGIQLDLDAFRLGAWDNWSTQPPNNLHGTIDDVRIYSGMLTAQQAGELAEGR